jgi:signal transduction histidine kinase
MKTNNYFIIATMALLLVSTVLKGQKKEQEEIKAALTLKLCGCVTWPADTNQYFTIGIISDNLKLSDKFNQLASNYSLHNKKIRIRIIGGNDFLSGIQAVYIDQENQKLIPEILMNVSRRNILVFTENYPVPREIMINLLVDQSKNTFTFEFNRANLVFEGFEIHSDIIILRGSEIDIRELYRQTQSRLEREEKNVRFMQAKLDTQQRSIEQQGQVIVSLNRDISEKNSIIQKQTDSISGKEQFLRVLSLKTSSQKASIENNLQTIDLQKEYIRKVKDTIVGQQSQIFQQTQNLDALNRKVDQKITDLQRKDTILAEKEMLLKFKNNLIYLLGALFLLVFVVIFLILKAYKTNRAARQILAGQKEELEVTLNKLTLAQEQLIQAEKMASIGVLTAGIAHEINNPVNFIKSGISGLQKSNKNIIRVLEKYHEKYSGKPENKEIDELEKQVDLNFLLDTSKTLTDNIKVGVDRTVTIIKSLRTFSHSDQETIKAVNVHESIELALTILHNQYKYNIEIEREFAELPNIDCYPGKLNQVFMNLLTNAIQSIPEKGKITIKTKSLVDHISISIKDTGVGIPDKIRNKVFDPFFTTKEVGKGTGMGLSIVFSIIEEHKGKIDFVSEIGHGTEFIINLPMKQA